MVTSISLHWTIFRQRTGAREREAGEGWTDRTVWSWVEVGKSFDQGDNLILFIRGRVSSVDGQNKISSSAVWVTHSTPRPRYPIKTSLDGQYWMDIHTHCVYVFMACNRNTIHVDRIVHPQVATSPSSCLSFHPVCKGCGWWPLAFVILLPVCLPCRISLLLLYQGTFSNGGI